MFVLPCLFLVFCCCSHVYSIPTNILLVSIDGGKNQSGMEATCSEVECPELNCEKTTQEEGKCCKSCDNSGSYSIVKLLSPSDWSFYS